MTKFKEIAQINPTETLKKNTLARYVAMENLQPFTRQITRYYAKKYSGGMKFRNGDTLMARITPCLENGKTAYVDILDKNEVGFGSTEYIVIRGKENISDGMYLYYLATSSRFREIAIKAMSGTSGRQRVQIDVLKDADINLPSLSEQKRIASILSSFDNKIELLKKENNTLEDIAQSIFKEWFVKYNFPNKDGKPYKDNNGKMIDSELGLIPEGWRVGKLGEIVNCFDSKRIPLAKEIREQRKGIYPYYGATEIMGYVDSFLFDGKYLLLAEDGSVQTEKGYPILQLIDEKFWVNNHTHVLQGKDPFTTEYLYLLMKDFNITNIITGAVQPKINQQNLLNLQMVIPSSAITQNCMQYFTKIYKKINTNEIFLSRIKKIRNIQLQKLIHS